MTNLFAALLVLFSYSANAATLRTIRMDLATTSNPTTAGIQIVDGSDVEYSRGMYSNSRLIEIKCAINTSTLIAHAKVAKGFETFKFKSTEDCLSAVKTASGANYHKVLVLVDSKDQVDSVIFDSTTFTY